MRQKEKGKILTVASFTILPLQLEEMMDLKF
jgi:hypothetical protein